MKSENFFGNFFCCRPSGFINDDKDVELDEV